MANVLHNAIRARKGFIFVRNTKCIISFACFAIFGRALVLHGGNKPGCGFGFFVFLLTTPKRLGMVLASAGNRSAPPGGSGRRQKRSNMSTPEIQDRLTFSEAVNWEYVHSHHTAAMGKLTAESPFVALVIEHARRNGFKGKITNRGAARVINAHLI